MIAKSPVSHRFVVIRTLRASSTPTETRIVRNTHGAAGFSPVLARTESVHRRRDPIAHCVKPIFVWAGAVILFSEFGERPAKCGDVVLLAANTLCGAEPEKRVTVTVTTLYLDRDYVVDQVFWQHAALLTARLPAKDFIAAHYTEPAQILCLGEDRAGSLMLRLD